MVVEEVPALMWVWVFMFVTPVYPLREGWFAPEGAYAPFDQEAGLLTRR